MSQPTWFRTLWANQRSVNAAAGHGFTRHLLHGRYAMRSMPATRRVRECRSLASRSTGAPPTLMVTRRRVFSKVIRKQKCRGCGRYPEAVVLDLVQPIAGSMSGDGKRSVAAWPKLPRPSSTLPDRHSLRVPNSVAIGGTADISGLEAAGGSIENVESPGGLSPPGDSSRTSPP
jgi:hypothetical protein